MLHNIRTERDYAAAFITAIVITFIVNILTQFPWFPLCIRTPSSILYSFIIIAWTASVAQRIVHKRIRRHIVAIAVFLLILFIVRICRWKLFLHSSFANRYLWYLYYIPFVAMPMLSFSAASCVGKDENNRFSAFIRAEWTAAVLLIVGMLTNDLHHFALSFIEDPDKPDQVNYHWLYYVVFVWSFVVTLSSYVLLIKRCRLSQCRKQWYVPIIPSAAAFLLIVVYYALGGSSPTVSGISIYNIHEVYLALFMGLWEGCIRIGLIPSNTGYNRLFEITHINAEMKSPDGSTVYRSGDYSDTEGNLDYNHKTYTIRG